MVLSSFWKAAFDKKLLEIIACYQLIEYAVFKTLKYKTLEKSNKSKLQYRGYLPGNRTFVGKSYLLLSRAS